MIPKDLVLENERVLLEPLDFRHAADLQQAGNDDVLWRKTFRKNPFGSLGSTHHYIADAVYGKQTAPGGVPFAIVERTSGKAIGATRFFDISPANRSLEIGWTWIARSHWRTHVNTNCKFLLLQYAFERAELQRVQFKADSENDRSRAAIARIGATYEGTLRNVRAGDDSMRSSSVYSILHDEWPAIKTKLLTLVR